MKVSLEDLYTGCAKRIKITRKKKCGGCGGFGGDEGYKMQCQQCEGKGYFVITNQMGPNLIRQHKSLDNVSFRDFLFFCIF